MSVDIAGPYIPGCDQDQGQPKYFLITTATAPIRQDRPLIWGWRPDDSIEEVEEGAEHMFQDRQEVMPEEQDPNPFRGADDEAAAQAGEANLASFEQCVAELKDVGSSTWRWQHLSSIAKKRQCLQRRPNCLQDTVLCRFQSSALRRTGRKNSCPSDSGSGQLRETWSIAILGTTSLLLLQSAGLPIREWPTALRHAADKRHHGQLRALGLDLPRLGDFKRLEEVIRRRTELMQLSFYTLTIHTPLRTS